MTLVPEEALTDQDQRRIWSTSLTGRDRSTTAPQLY